MALDFLLVPIKVRSLRDMSVCFRVQIWMLVYYKDMAVYLRVEFFMLVRKLDLLVS